MNKIDSYIPPNIRLINPISKRFTNNRRFTSNELPTWVEQSQEIMLRSTVSSHHYIFGLFLVFQSSFKLHFPYPLLSLAIYDLHAGYHFVTDTHSTPTIMEPPSMECQDLLISCQIECMCCQN